MQRSIEEPASGQRDETLQGVVERVTFHNPQNGYTIARVAVRGLADLATVVGNFAQLQPGQTMQFWGCWKEHPSTVPSSSPIATRRPAPPPLAASKNISDRV